MWTAIPEPNLDELVEGSVLALEKVVEAGVTCVHWIVASLAEFSVVQKLRSEGRLPLGVKVIAAADVDQPPPQE